MENISAQENVPKKRGRRKKIISETESKNTPKKPYKKTIDSVKSLDMLKNTFNQQRNSILYLKCSIADIERYIIEQKWKTDEFTYDPKVPTEFIPYDQSQEETNKHLIEKPDLDQSFTNSKFICSICQEKDTKRNFGITEKNDIEFEVSSVLKDLKISFFNTNVLNKKSDCFWCTFPYDNDSFHILQYGSEDNILAHGSFCSPQCAVAHLFENMKWDDSMKFESYQLINQFYNTNNDNENIKPAASPYFLLDKFFGNMSIHDFRKMSNSSHVMICIDKPVTRIIPEIHEDNEKYMQNKNTRGNYKVKKQSEKNKAISRNSILRDTFRSVVTN